MGYSLDSQQNWRIPLKECCPLLKNETRTSRPGDRNNASNETLTEGVIPLSLDFILFEN